MRNLKEETFYLASYFDSRMMGLDDNYQTSDATEAEDWAWEHLNQGGYVEIKNQRTGKEVYLDPDDLLFDYDDYASGAFEDAINDSGVFIDPEWHDTADQEQVDQPDYIPDGMDESMGKEIKRYSDVYSDERRNQGWWYFTTHGIQPGSVPKGVNILEVRDTPNGTYFRADAILNTSELEYYDIKERVPKEEESLKEDFNEEDFHIEKGHTIDEYMKLYGDQYEDGDLWDFLISEVEDGSVDLDEDTVYWQIGDRYYETGEEPDEEKEVSDRCSTCCQIDFFHTKDYDEDVLRDVITSALEEQGCSWSGYMDFYDFTDDYSESDRLGKKYATGFRFDVFHKEGQFDPEKLVAPINKALYKMGCRWYKDIQVEDNTDAYGDDIEDYFGESLNKKEGINKKPANTKINIRESLNKYDLRTDNKYDLRNLYDACIMTDKEKRIIAEMISKNTRANVLYEALMNKFDGKELKEADERNADLDKGIKDEQETINLYDKMSKKKVFNGVERDQIKEIRNDEKDHKRLLKKIKDGKLTRVEEAYDDADLLSSCKEKYRRLIDIADSAGDFSSIKEVITAMYDEVGGKVRFEEVSRRYASFSGSVKGHSLWNSVSLEYEQADLHRLAEDLTMAFYRTNGGQGYNTYTLMNAIHSLMGAEVGTDENESLKEEYGEFKDEPYMEEIARMARQGYYHGEVDGVEWEITFNGYSGSDFNSLSFLEYMLDTVSYPISDGHLRYYDLDCYISDFNDEYDSARDDLKEIFQVEDGDLDGANGGLEFWCDYDVDFDIEEWERNQLDDDEDEGEYEDEDDYDESLKEGVNDRLRQIAEPLANALDDLTDRDDGFYITYSIGIDDNGAVTGGVDFELFKSSRTEEEAKAEIERVFDENGFELDRRFKTNPGKTLFGRTHYQIIEKDK